MESVERHLKNRHVDFDLHRPMVDEENRVATFYLYNMTGMLCGYQQYRPDATKSYHNDPKLGRYYTYRKQPTLALFGVESLPLNNKVVFLTEGVFDACRLTKRGYAALAVLSNDPSHELHNFLYCLNRKVVAVCDNDVAGKKLAKFGDVAVYTADKDLGDSTDEFVDHLLRTHG